MSCRSTGLRARISPRLVGPLVIAVAALALPPLARAADAPVDVTGTIEPGTLSIAAPQIVSNFTKALDGHTFTKSLEVPDWTVTDATGAGAGSGTFSHGLDNTDLSVVIPADAPTGAYRTTLTFTVNARVS